MNSDAYLKKILTTSRHCKITTICAHLARKEIGSFLRSVLDYLIVYSTPNDRIVKQIYEEYFSRQHNPYDDFSYDYRKYIDNDKHNALIIDLQNKKFSFDVKYFILNQ